MTKFDLKQIQILLNYHKSLASALDEEIFPALFIILSFVFVLSSKQRYKAKRSRNQALCQFHKLLQHVDQIIKPLVIIIISLSCDSFPDNIQSRFVEDCTYRDFSSVASFSFKVIYQSLAFFKNPIFKSNFPKPKIS